MLSRNSDRKQFLEADWRKVYINDLVTLLKLPVPIKGLLYEIAKLINFQGIVTLKSDVRKAIAETLRISTNTLDNYVAVLVEWEILKYTDRETFKLNSDLFNPKDWIELDRCREPSILKLRLNVTYLSDGHKKIEVTCLHESE